MIPSCNEAPSVDGATLQVLTRTRTRTSLRGGGRRLETYPAEQLAHLVNGGSGAHKGAWHMGGG